MKKLLCDTITHPTPVLKGWYYGLTDLGYTPSYLPVPQYSILAVEEEYDVIVYPHIRYELLNEFETFKKRFPKTKIIGCRDSWDPFNNKLKDIVDFFIVVLDSTPSVIKDYNDNGFECYNIPLGGNNKLFFKNNMALKNYDACFIGTLAHGVRGEDKYLYPILDKYNCFLGGMNYKQYQYGFIPYETSNEYRNQSKINLNFHYGYQIKGKGKKNEPGNKNLDRNDLNQSTHNIALSGNFQLCDHPSVLEIYQGNIPVADKDNWLEMFEYYLNKEQEREELAYYAKLIAQKEHTWKVRMEQFIDILNTHYEK